MVGGLGSSAAAIVAGLLAADHLSSSTPTCSTAAIELEGHPDNVAAALRGGFVVCADGQVARFDAPVGLEAVLVVPHDAGAHRRGARRAAGRGADGRRRVQRRAHRRCSRSGLARGEWDLVAAGLHDRLHQPRRAHLYPRSLELAERARELGALGATISGAGPTVLVWTHYEQTGGGAGGPAPGRRRRTPP